MLFNAFTCPRFSAVCRSSFLHRHHPVPDANPRLNVLLAIAVLFELPSELGHEYAQRRDTFLIQAFPDIADNHAVCEHPAGILGQQLEDSVLNRRQMDDFSPDRHLHRIIVNAEAAVFKDGCGIALSAVKLHAPGRCPHARHELIDIEGLGHIIVRAVIQCLNLVHVVAAGADDDDGVDGHPADTTPVSIRRICMAASLSSAPHQPDEARRMASRERWSGTVSLPGERGHCTAFPIKVRLKGIFTGSDCVKTQIPCPRERPHRSTDAVRAL